MVEACRRPSFRRPVWLRVAAAGVPTRASTALPGAHCPGKQAALELSPEKLATSAPPARRRGRALTSSVADLAFKRAWLEDIGVRGQRLVTGTWTKMHEVDMAKIATFLDSATPLD